MSTNLIIRTCHRLVKNLMSTPDDRVRVKGILKNLENIIVRVFYLLGVLPFIPLLLCVQIQVIVMVVRLVTVKRRRVGGQFHHLPNL